MIARDRLNVEKGLTSGYGCSLRTGIALRSIKALMQIDVPKLVGAASASVALIIATSIFLGNLGGKYSMLARIFRQISDEYRKSEDKHSLRSRSLIEQLRLYRAKCAC